MATTQLEQSVFEDEIRQIGRILWVEAALGGSKELEGRERDGVFEARDIIHVVEAAVSAKKEKAEDDAKKTAQTVANIRKSKSKFAQGWLITQNEPTVDQKRVVEKYSHSVKIMSFEQFRSLLFNGGEYLRCRSNVPFGSITDPYTRSSHVDRSAYIPLELFDTSGNPPASAHSIAEQMLSKPLRALVLGDYGAGKSMTAREIFFYLKDKYLSASTKLTPVYLNLRDHRGQVNPVEALERHAREIGYSAGASDLVRAWRAGHIHLILDGFDEIATAGWGHSLRRVREHRYAAMALVRNFVAQSDPGGSLIVAGRSNYFDSPREMEKALNVETSWHKYSLNDFTPEQTARFLKKIGFKSKIPEWLPSRPLLVAYFALFGRGENTYADLSGLTAGAGWDKFLDMISHREAKQVDERQDPETIRQIIERLATRARATPDGLGRLSIDIVQEAYRDVVGSLPDEDGQALLLRLPGLAASAAEDGTRSFLDAQFASAARAGDVIRFVLEPFTFETALFSDTQSTIGEGAKELIEARRDDGRLADGHIKAAYDALRTRNHPAQLAMDLTAALLRSGDGGLLGGIEIDGALEDEILVDENIDLSQIIFSDCLISKVNVESSVDFHRLPFFKDCVIGVVSGVSKREFLPEQLSSSDISSVISGSETNDAIMTLNIVEPVKVLLTVLNKIYLQHGGGRQASALHRGLDPRAAQFVPDILELVERKGFATRTRVRGKEIWMANRSLSGRVKHILSAPLLSTDPILKEAANI
jgi:NACHT domain